MKGSDTFTQAESTTIGTLRRAERPAQKSIRESLRQQSGFYISDWQRDATGFTRSDFDELVRQGHPRHELGIRTPAAESHPRPPA
jgi:hypothetical protein